MSGLLLQQVEGLNEAEQHQLEALLKKMLAGIDAI